MRRMFVLALIGFACRGGGDDKPRAGSGSVLGIQPKPETFDLCKVGIDHLAKLACKAPEAARQVMQARSAIEGIVDTARKTPDTDPQKFQVLCAQLVQAIDRDAAKLGCAPPLDAAARTKITGVLDAFYARRTAIVPTGDPAGDAAIKKLAGVRDAACACPDVACMDKLVPQLDAAVAQVPAKARDLASKLIDDAGRCLTRLRTR